MRKTEKFCSNCGALIEQNDWRNCPWCGSGLEDEEEEKKELPPDHDVGMGEGMQWGKD